MGNREPFGFSVRYEEARVPGDQAGWQVDLPHQCGPWRIAGERFEYSDGVALDEAIADLEAFISEAQEALAALRAGRELER